MRHVSDVNKKEPSWNDFATALKEFKAKADQQSEAAEPQFCECGELSMVTVAEMELDVKYCDSYNVLMMAKDVKRKGFIATGEHIYYIGPCPEIANRKKQEKVKKILDLYGDMTFDKFDRSNDPSNQFEKVFSWLPANSAGMPQKLMIGGLRGRGKTHLARALYIKLQVECGINCEWFYVEDLNEIFRKRSMGEGEELTEADSVYERIIAADCLFIDDLGEEKIPRNSDLFFVEFKALLQKLKSIVITTNLGSEALMKRYQGKIHDRIFEHCITAVLTGANYREKSFPALKSSPSAQRSLT